MTDFELAQQVYDSLLGNLLPEYALDWVDEIFLPGNGCYEEYGRMLAAYQRLCARLGTGDEDGDLEIVVDALLSHGKMIALEMFRYGVEYGKCKASE